MVTNTLYFFFIFLFSIAFVPHIDQLFDKGVLIGKGLTTNKSLQPLSYSTLANLVHHVHTHLPLSHLSLAVHVFAKNVHDDSLLVSIKTMSCKVGCKYSSNINVNKNQIYISIPIMKVEDQINFAEILLDFFFERQYATFCNMTQYTHCI